MNKKLLRLILALFVSVSFASISSATVNGHYHPSDSTKVQKKEVIVYRTKTGRKYHTANCRYLRLSKIPIKLSDAKAEGLTPCSVCNPPK